MVQLVGHLAETIIDLTGKEASTLALAASQAAHALDDPRYNGCWDARQKDHFRTLDSGEATTEHVDAWEAAKPDREAQQTRWARIATLLDPDTYPEGWKAR